VSEIGLEHLRIPAAQDEEEMRRAALRWPSNCNKGVAEEQLELSPGICQAPVAIDMSEVCMGGMPLLDEDDPNL